MSSLFGGGGTSSQQTAATALGKTANKQAQKTLTGASATASGLLTGASSKLSMLPGPSNLTGGGLGVGTTPQGINLTQSSGVQSAIGNLNAGLGSDMTAYNNALASVHPGFGQITQARRQAILSAQQKTVGDLQSQLQKRRLGGSSFANDSITNANADTSQQLAQADAQSFSDELAATQNLIQQRSAARTTDIANILSQSNFESSLGAGLLQSFTQAGSQTQSLMADLAKTNANLQVSAAQTGAGITGGIAQQQISALPNYATIAAQTAAAPGAILGTLGGAFLAGPAGAAVGKGISSSLFGSA